MRDIVPPTGPGSFTGSEFREVGGTVLFIGCEAATGCELWRTDGTLAGTALVADISPEWSSSAMSQLTVVGATLFFVLDDPATGKELWKSDGTADGTMRVKDIQPGPLGSDPARLTNFDGALYFSADDGVHGVELWRSDGTSVGTAMLKDIAMTGGSLPSSLVVSGGKLFFTANGGAFGNELWKTDGTTSGTEIVADLEPGLGWGSDPNYLTDVNGTLFFVRSFDSVNGRELWKSDGTAAGTVLVKDIAPGSASSVPSKLVNVAGTVFFVVGLNTGVGAELWKSDGTAAGTVLVKDIRVGSASSNPDHLAASGATLFFSADDGTTGREPWKSDGTPAGTVRLKDILPGTVGSSPTNFYDGNGTLYFAAFDPGSGNTRQVWRSDGTEIGTLPYTGWGGIASYNLQVMVTSNGTRYFAGSPPSQPTQVYADDSGPATPVPLNATMSPVSGDSSPDNFAPVGDLLFFTAKDAANDAGLWRTDGTEAGTIYLGDIGDDPYWDLASGFADLNGLLLFLNNGVLCRSDGTPGGTGPVGVPGLWSNHANAVVYNDSYFFAGSQTATGMELWKTDGTTAGTTLVKDIRPGSASSSPLPGVDWNGILLFTADDGTSGSELWRSDGTESGTSLVMDIVEGWQSSDASQLTATYDVVFFIALGDLWRTDGSALGTLKVKDLPLGFSPDFLTRCGEGVAFLGSSSGLLYHSDGTESGTVLLRNFAPHYIVSPLVEVGELVFFVVDTGTSFVLWRTDGTAEGTIELRQLQSIGPMAAMNGALWFSGSDATDQYPALRSGLWRSDGTPTGTGHVALFSAPVSCNAACMAAVDSVPFLSASTPATGHELWKLPPDGACGDAVVAGTEECDDGGLLEGDGCSASCAGEPGWTCVGSPSICSPVCGDGIVVGSEGCDDGNGDGADGCSAGCVVEFGYTCVGAPSFCTPSPACSDGLDNDGDALVDYPADTGCTGPSGPSEQTTAKQCDNGLDDDGDGKVDYRVVPGAGDPGCPNAASNLEKPQCQDGRNNDNQAGIDFDGGDSLDISPRDNMIDAQFTASGTPVAVGTPDPQCVGKPWQNFEKIGCGLGFELVLLAPILGRLARRRRLSGA